MARATWRILALSALLGSVALPVSAQVVIGGSGQPSVEVNWAVLDRLGRQPTLPDMLMGRQPAPSEIAVGKAKPGPQGVQFHPYKPSTAKVAKAKVSAPRKSSVVPVVAKAPPAASSPAAKVVPVSQKAEQVAAVPAAQAPAPVPVPAGPQISLPEVPAPAAPVAAPVKAEAPKVEAPKVEAPVVIAAAPVPVPVRVPEPVPAPVSAPVVVPAPVVPVPAAPAALTPPPPVPEPVQQLAAAPAVPPALAPVPMSVVASKGDTLSVVFGAESSTLPGAAQPELDKLVKRMKKEDGLGLQLLAFAEGDDTNASKARRMSLSRALEVRKYLMDQGVRSTRIEVRALGNKLEGNGPADRVDAVLINR